MGLAPFRFSADTGEILMVVVGAVSLAIMIAGVVMWRRDRLAPAVFIGAVLPTITATAAWRWDDIGYLVVFFLEACATAMIGYAALKARGFRALSACVGGIANAILSWAFLGTFGPSMTGERGLWVVCLLPVSLVGAVVVVLAAHGLRALASGAAAEREGSGDVEGSSEEDRGIVLKMLSEGKISVPEASALLEAGGGNRTPADDRPASRATRMSIVGGFMVLVGFMMPWVSVRLGEVVGFQTGRNVGFLGWLILSIGLLPAVLSCIPALDRHVRQGMLRLLLAAAGAAFAGTLTLQLALHGGEVPGIGLILTLGGFGVQIASGARVSGFFRGGGRA